MHLVCPKCNVTNRIAEEKLFHSPTCGKCGYLLMSTEPVAINDQALQKFIEKTELPVLIDFWADWCGPCRAMAPQFSEAAKLAPDIRFIKVDSDASPMASHRYGIRSIPTILLMKNGHELGRQSGVMPAAKLLAWARSLLPATNPNTV